jgi:hypothetical protein
MLLFILSYFYALVLTDLQQVVLFVTLQYASSGALAFLVQFFPIHTALDIPAIFRNTGSSSCGVTLQKHDQGERRAGQHRGLPGGLWSNFYSKHTELVDISHAEMYLLPHITRSFSLRKSDQ